MVVSPLVEVLPELLELLELLELELLEPLLVPELELELLEAEPLLVPELLELPVPAEEPPQAVNMERAIAAARRPAATRFVIRIKNPPIDSGMAALPKASC